MRFDPQQYFSSVVELSKDSGLIGQILRRYQDLLPAADKWAEQTYDYEQRHRVPNRLPLPDPWQFLLEARAVSSVDRAVFRAAQSQLPGLSHLIGMAQGSATLNTNWYQKLIDAQAIGDKRAAAKAARKISDRYVLNEYVQKDYSQKNPEHLKQLARLSKERRAQLIHRGERFKLEQFKRWPQWDEFKQHHKLEAALVQGWVRCGINGMPGLMFWRNEALTKFLVVHLDQANLDPRGVKKTRQQLGLIPIGNKTHFVWDLTIATNSEGNREIRGFWRNGRQSFWSVILPKNRDFVRGSAPSEIASNRP